MQSGKEDKIIDKRYYAIDFYLLGQPHQITTSVDTDKNYSQKKIYGIVKEQLIDDVKFQSVERTEYIYENRNR